MAMEEQAKLLADLTAAVSSMKAKIDDMHLVVLELNQCRPGVERAVDALRAEMGDPQDCVIDATRQAACTGSITTAPATCSMEGLSHDATKSRSAPAIATAPTPTTAIVDVNPVPIATAASDQTIGGEAISRAGSTPATCSSVCPSGDASALRSAIIPSATQTSSMALEVFFLTALTPLDVTAHQLLQPFTIIEQEVDANRLDIKGVTASTASSSQVQAALIIDDIGNKIQVGSIMPFDPGRKLQSSVQALVATPLASSEPCCREGEQSVATHTEILGVCLHQRQFARSGIEWAAPRRVIVIINHFQLNLSGSNLAYPADMGPYCSSISSATEVTPCESNNWELNSWVSCMVEQNTDMSTYGIKTGLHFLCISISTFWQQNRSVVYALLILFQSAARKYVDLWWFTTAPLTEIQSTFSVVFPVQMDVTCSVQPFFYVEETLMHEVFSGRLSVDEHQLSTCLSAKHPTHGVTLRLSTAYAELRFLFSGSAISSAVAVSLEDGIVAACLNLNADCTSIVRIIIQKTLLGLNQHTSLTYWKIVVSNTISLQLWFGHVLDCEVDHGPFLQHAIAWEPIQKEGTRPYPVLVAVFTYIISANTEVHEAMEHVDTLVHGQILRRAEFEGSGNYSSGNMAIGTKHMSSIVNSVMSTMFCDADLSILIICKIGWPPRDHACFITIKLSSKGTDSRHCLCWSRGGPALLSLLAFDRQAKFQGGRCAMISITRCLALANHIEYIASLSSNGQGTTSSMGPWCLSGFTFCRLEGKPDVKEGRMSRTVWAAVPGWMGRFKKGASGP